MCLYGDLDGGEKHNIMIVTSHTKRDVMGYSRWWNLAAPLQPNCTGVAPLPERDVTGTHNVPLQNHYCHAHCHDFIVMLSLYYYYHYHHYHHHQYGRPTQGEQE